MRYVYICKVIHPETSYLNLCRKIIEEGTHRPDRTEVGTKSIFGEKLEFDITETIPLLTTKQVSFDNIIQELLWMVSGNTDANSLEEKGVTIWKKNTTKQFLDNHNPRLDYIEGDIGPLYGYNWRHWGAEYKGCKSNYKDQGIDQLSRLITGLRREPMSRRHILTTWNVATLDKGVLYPCHVLCQFYVDSSRTWLDLQVYQRSADVAVGLPYNIVFYSVLTYMIGHLTQLKPRKLIYVMGDTHIYNNHFETLNKQLARTPKPFPKLILKNTSQVFEIDDFKTSNFEIKEYSSWPYLKYEMNV